MNQRRSFSLSLHKRPSQRLPLNPQQIQRRTANKQAKLSAQQSPAVAASAKVPSAPTRSVCPPPSHRSVWSAVMVCVITHKAKTSVHVPKTACNQHLQGHATRNKVTPLPALMANRRAGVSVMVKPPASQSADILERAQRAGMIAAMGRGSSGTFAVSAKANLSVTRSAANQKAGTVMVHSSRMPNVPNRQPPGRVSNPQRMDVHNVSRTKIVHSQPAHNMARTASNGVRRVGHSTFAPRPKPYTTTKHVTQKQGLACDDCIRSIHICIFLEQSSRPLTNATPSASFLERNRAGQSESNDTLWCMECGALIPDGEDTCEACGWTFNTTN